MKSLLMSLLKYARDDIEGKFFARIIDSNASKFQIWAINKGIITIRKNHGDFSSKGDHNFRKVKIQIKEIVKHLLLIFSRIVSFENQRQKDIVI